MNCLSSSCNRSSKHISEDNLAIPPIPKERSHTYKIANSSLSHPRRSSEKRLRKYSEPIDLQTTPFLQEKFRQFGHAGGASRHGYTTDSANTFEYWQAKTIKDKDLFKDPAFPADDTSVFINPKKSKLKDRLPHNIHWKRPQEILASRGINGQPEFIILNEANENDVIQGHIGDCWLVAAMANLVGNKKLRERVIQPSQGFSKAQLYCGIFRFRIWRQGYWLEVFVDDRLPTFSEDINDTQKHLILRQSQAATLFMKPSSKNEFWAALLEKAYAKVHGGYEYLEGGQVLQAMQDFSGGLSEFVNKKKLDVLKFDELLSTWNLGCMMACGVGLDPLAEERRKLSIEAAQKGQCIKFNHAYSVIDVRRIPVEQNSGFMEQVECIRVRDPQGYEARCEWGLQNEDFSKKSPIWNRVPENLRVELNSKDRLDGEYWMRFTDFKKRFSHLEICLLGIEHWIELDQASQHRWRSLSFTGSWTKGVSAGGQPQSTSFYQNPQYRIRLTDKDRADGKATCIVSLSQNEKGALRKDIKAIGVAIYQDFFVNHPKMLLEQFSEIDYKKQITQRFGLPLGEYCIIPFMYQAGVEREFLLRVFSATPFEMEEHDNFYTLVPESEDEEHVQPLSNEVEQLFHRYQVEEGLDLTAFFRLIHACSFKTSFLFKGFSLETAYSLFVLVDHEQSWRIGLHELAIMWDCLEKWKAPFEECTPNSKGEIKLDQLRKAFFDSGHCMNNDILRLISKRYGKNDLISFDIYISCIARLRKARRDFVDMFEENRAQFEKGSLDQSPSLSLFYNSFLLKYMQASACNALGLEL